MVKSEKLSKFELFHIVPGYKCNLFCDHCATDSGPSKDQPLKSIELEQIKNFIHEYHPPIISFTGGEPFLYSEPINKILAFYEDLTSIEIRFTTNAFFSKSVDLIKKYINPFPKIDCLQVSYDLFHGNKLEISDLQRLEEYCNTNKIHFLISITVSNPEQLIQARKLKESLNCQIIFQKVDSCGRAKKSNLSFDYPFFEKESLSKSCPNIKAISYIAGKGFTTCCGNLVFNHSTSSFYQPTFSDFIDSKFYKLMSENSFEDISQIMDVNTDTFPSEYSSLCNLCEAIYLNSNSRFDKYLI